MTWGQLLMGALLGVALAALARHWLNWLAACLDHDDLGNKKL